MSARGSQPPRVRVAPRAWWVLVLMTLDYALGMIDRNTVSVLKTTLKGVWGIDDAQYGLLVTAFLVSYAVCYIFAGLIVDRIGSRASFTIFITLWSGATIASGLVSSYGEMLAWRVVLGAAEAGLLPATIVALVNWFPRDRLATAYAIKTPLQFLGPILSPPLIVWLTTLHGWRSAFVLPGLVGLVFAALWWASDRNRPDYGEAPAAAAATPRPSLRALVSNPAVVTLLIARLLSDPVWFFFQAWQAGYLQEVLGRSLGDVGRLLWLPPAITAVLTFATALWSDRMIRGGRSAASSRLRVLAGTTCCAPLLLLLLWRQPMPVVIGILSATYFMTYTWLYLTNLMVADLFPRATVGAAVGLIGTVGTIGAAAFNWAAGYVIRDHGYAPVFLLCALLHPAALLLLWLRLRGQFGAAVRATAPPSSGHSDTIVVSTPSAASAAAKSSASSAGA